MAADAVVFAPEGAKIAPSITILSINLKRSKELEVATSGDGGDPDLSPPAARTALLKYGRYLFDCGQDTT